MTARKDMTADQYSCSSGRSDTYFRSENTGHNHYYLYLYFRPITAYLKRIAREQPQDLSFNEIFAPLSAVMSFFALLLSASSALTAYHQKPQDLLLAIQRMFHEEGVNEVYGTWLGPGNDMLFVDAKYKSPNLGVEKLLRTIENRHAAFDLCNVSTFGEKLGEPNLTLLYKDLNSTMSITTEIFRAYGSAYQLARIFQVTPSDTSSRIATKPALVSVENPTIELYNGQFYFPIEDAKLHWKLITSVHTVWDDPAESGFLRAHTPWGTLQCNNLDAGKMLCSFQRLDPPGWPEGECTYFDLWSYNWEGRCFDLKELNAANWLERYFALHMQEETIYRIYRYSVNLLRVNGHNIKEIPPRVNGRTRETYKMAAIWNFHRYLEAYPFRLNLKATEFNLGGDRGNIMNYFGGCRDEYSANQISIASSNKDLDDFLSQDLDGWDIDKQEKLDLFTQQPRQELSSDVVREYQTFIAFKLGRLAVKAAVFDDRFAMLGFMDRTFWIG